MKMVPLGEIIRKSGSRAKEDTAYPVYSVTKHGGFVPSEQYFKKQVFSKDLSTYTRVKAGEFAYATIHLDEGSIGIAPVDCLISPMYTVFAADQNEADPNYLIKQLKSPPAIAQYDRLGNGSVHRRRSIPLSALSQLNVPLPPLDEQRRIAAILDKADAIRQKRRQAITHLDTLTQAFFQTMFGELPAQTSFGDVVKRFRNGVSPSNSGTTEAKVLTLSAITQGQFDPAQAKFAMFDSIPGSDKRVSSDDLLICRGNGNKSLVGASEYSKSDLPDLVFPDTMIAAQVDESSASIEYLHAAWRSTSSRRQIESKARTTNGTYKINQTALSQVKIPMPSKADQDQFQLATSGIDGCKRLFHDALSVSESAFASLQSRAFRGEL